MRKNVPNILLLCKRYFLVFAAMLLVLLSSCAIKTSIKSFANIPIQNEQGSPKSNHKFLLTEFEECAQMNASDQPSVQNISFKAIDLLSVVFFTAAVYFIFSFTKLSRIDDHPIYTGTSKIRNSISIFLEYRKLIIHYIQ